MEEHHLVGDPKLMVVLYIRLFQLALDTVPKGTTDLKQT